MAELNGQDAQSAARIVSLYNAEFAAAYTKAAQREMAGLARRLNDYARGRSD